MNPPSGPDTMRSVVFRSPVVLPLLLVAWTAAVYPYSQYDSWQIYPAMAILPLVLIGHAILIVSNKPRLPQVLLASIHWAVLIPVWIGCLMLISKNSI